MTRFAAAARPAAHPALRHTSVMARPTGSADLPLHSGHVPAWLASRMAALGRIVCEAIVHHYGRDELLRRLAHPFWFQSFGAVMGMDWHSSGITTSVLGALKRGRHSRDTPAQLLRAAERTGLDGQALARTSRLVAKVDSAAVQDGYDLYLHAFVLSAEGRWCIVQQGMNTARREARRYHWLSEGLQSFLDSPHSAIEGRGQGVIVNLADARAARNRQESLRLLHAGPDRTIATLRRLQRRSAENLALDLFAEPDIESATDAPGPHLRMPSHHDVRAADVDLKRLHATLRAAAERGPADFPELLLTPGIGARTVAALALVAEVVHGSPSRFSDPARFAFAHGGKDAHPFPVPLTVYDETLRVLRDALSRARLGQSDRLAALQRLDRQARALEQLTDGTSGASFQSLLQAERTRSAQLGGRCVFGPV